MPQKRKHLPKTERFARALAENLATGMSEREAATAASKLLGYKGSKLSFVANSVRRARNPKVAKRVAELLGPIDKAKKDSMSPADVRAVERIEINRDWTKQKLARILSVDLPLEEVCLADQIRAAALLFEIEKWEHQTQQPIHTELTGMTLDQLKAEIIERARGLGLFDEPFRLVDGKKV